MDRWKAEQGRGREKRKIRREKSRRERVRRKKIQMREKVGKSRFTVFFQWFVAPEGRKVGSLKRRVRSQLARREMKNCTPLWREAHFQVKMYKNTPCSDHFWRFRCQKSARRCGAKHISKSKCTKHTSFGPLLEVEMSKKCTPLWREAHFQVKMYKTLHVRATFGGSYVEKVHAVVARSTFRSQNVQNTTCSRHFWRFICRKKCTPLWREAHLEVKMLKTPGIRTTFGGSDVASLHYTTLHYTTLHNTTTTTTQLHSTTLNYTTLHYITLHYTPLHYITLHCTTVHYTSLHYTQLHYTTTTTTQLHSTTIRTTTLHYTKLHYTTLHYTTLHSTTLHYMTLHYLPLHFTTLHYTTLHSTTPTTLHYITLHYITLNDTAPQIDR